MVTSCNEKKKLSLRLNFSLKIQQFLFSIHWNRSQKYVIHTPLAPLYVFINHSDPLPWVSKLLKEAITYCGKYNYLVASTLFDVYF